jgi:hypothetical protein
VVDEYRMADRLPLARSRAVLVCGADDAHALLDVPTLTARLGCRRVVIERAGVA